MLVPRRRERRGPRPVERASPGEQRPRHPVDDTPTGHPEPQRTGVEPTDLQRPDAQRPDLQRPDAQRTDAQRPEHPRHRRRLHLGQLVAGLAPADAPPGRGAAVLTLTNTGRGACHLKGFGGIALSRSDGAPVLSRQVRSDATPPALTLAPGDVARSSLSWSTVANTAVGEPATGDCEAVPTSLLVIPPDQIDDRAVPWSAGPVCDQGTITQTPYALG